MMILKYELFLKMILIIFFGAVRNDIHITHCIFDLPIVTHFTK